VKALSTSFMQIHRELEEAAWICGRGLLGTIATIMLPLAGPGLVASMTLLFVLACASWDPRSSSTPATRP
jgi:iron(III) transport system permease protein